MEKRILEILNNNEFGELAKNNRYITGIRTEHFKRIAKEIAALNELIIEADTSENATDVIVSVCDENKKTYCANPNIKRTGVCRNCGGQAN